MDLYFDSTSGTLLNIQEKKLAISSAWTWGICTGHILWLLGYFLSRYYRPPRSMYDYSNCNESMLSRSYNINTNWAMTPKIWSFYGFSLQLIDQNQRISWATYIDLSFKILGILFCRVTPVLTKCAWQRFQTRRHIQRHIQVVNRGFTKPQHPGKLPQIR